MQPQLAVGKLIVGTFACTTRGLHLLGRVSCCCPSWLTNFCFRTNTHTLTNTNTLGYTLAQPRTHKNTRIPNTGANHLDARAQGLFARCNAAGKQHQRLRAGGGGGRRTGGG